MFELNHSKRKFSEGYISNGMSESRNDQNINHWEYKLLEDGNGKLLKRSLENAAILLSLHPKMKSVFWSNTFTKKIEIRNCPAWDDPSSFKSHCLTDNDPIFAKRWLECQGIAISVTETFAAISSIAEINSYNPLQEYLNNLVWDGVNRLDSWLSKYLGAETNTYTKAVSKKFAIGSVARALKPGCKMDTVLILEGKQGSLKSTAVKVLFSEEYYTDEIAGIGQKDTSMQMLGRWVIEIAEYDALDKAETKAIKAFLSRSTDKFRPPYGRTVIEQPRYSVFVATINPDGEGYLKDPTGARRFWPVKCNTIDIEGLAKIRDQLWAEAVYRFNEGEKWWLIDEEIAFSEEEQQARYEEDSWASQIDIYTEDKSSFTVTDILAQGLSLSFEKRTNAAKGRVGKYLTSKGFNKKQVRIPGTKIRHWVYNKMD